MRLRGAMFCVQHGAGDTDMRTAVEPWGEGKDRTFFSPSLRGMRVIMCTVPDYVACRACNVLQQGTASNCSAVTFTWSWDLAETRSLMSVMGVGLIEENTNTPSDEPDQSPPNKRARPCQGKENQPPNFLVSKRFRKPDPSTAVARSWEDLPEELLLVIFHSLSLPHLLKIAQVNRRWHRLAFDKSLWYSVDLSKARLPLGTLGQVLASGVVVLRSPRSFLGDPMFKDDRPLPLQYLDLSHCVISCTAILHVLARCHRLLGLSLEGLSLSDHIVRAVGRNDQLQRLNVASCSGFGPGALRQMLKDCPR
ncbi:S-phase kinase-associated protein 2 [Narcine bancroftii]|uniref:S-phase kinase-associated protein 2 n=1 Tax=Narcine bancroftii TaxID=1343680 RepID=UPI003831DE50